MKKDAFLSYLLLTVTSVIFGFSFLVTRDALDALGVFQLLGLRFLAAALVLTVLAVTGIVKVRLSRAKLKMMLPLMLLQPLVYFVGETFGIRLTSASESGMMIALIPITIALFSARSRARSSPYGSGYPSAYRSQAWCSSSLRAAFPAAAAYRGICSCWGLLPPRGCTAPSQGRYRCTVRRSRSPS